MDKDYKRKNEKKCNFNCKLCQHYNKQNDFCNIKKINECTKKAHLEFSTCQDYLINENLVMF